MIKVRERQIAKLLQTESADWVAFVIDTLADAYPRSPLFQLEPQARPGRILDWCDRARANDLEADEDIISFLFVMHEMVPGFDQHPTLRAVLDQREAPAGERWERLFDTRDDALDQAWGQIERVDARTHLDWDIAAFPDVQSAFPTTFGDARFIRYFQAAKARRLREGRH
jgi:hypothetical protein